MLAERVFIPNRDAVLKMWVAAYAKIDTTLSISQERFEAFCARELDALIAALASGNRSGYLEHEYTAGVELAEYRFPLERVPKLVHELEDSYSGFLFREFHRAEELPHLLHALDALLHDAMEAMVAGYFKVAQEKVTQELAIGRILEAAFRPKGAPPIPGVEVGVEYRSATERALVGGDFFDFFFLPDGRLSFVLGDVSGKGINAASTAAMTKHMLRGFACEETRPEAALQRLNKALEYLLAPGEFVSAVLAVYSPAEAEIELVGAGHPPSFLVTGGGRVERLETGGLLVGVGFIADEKNIRFRLDSGDRLVFYTDGLIEARSGADFYGYDRPERLLAGMHGRPPQEIVDELVSDCLHFCGSGLKDDLAVVCFGKV